MYPMRTSMLALCTVLLGLAAPAGAAPPSTPAPAKAAGPCAQIAAACKQAGFIEGDYKIGTGLQVDCIDPIMRGTPQPPKAKLQLPQVSPQLVAACKAKDPAFGQPKAAKAK
jgi:hypothetical protein